MAEPSLIVFFLFVSVSICMFVEMIDTILFLFVCLYFGILPYLRLIRSQAEFILVFYYKKGSNFRPVHVSLVNPNHIGVKYYLIELGPCLCFELLICQK